MNDRSKHLQLLTKLKASDRTTPQSLSIEEFKLFAESVIKTELAAAPSADPATVTPLTSLASTGSKSLQLKDKQKSNAPGPAATNVVTFKPKSKG